MKVDYHAVLAALYATEAGQRYLECIDLLFNALDHQDSLWVRDEVVFLLEHKSRPQML